MKIITNCILCSALQIITLRYRDNNLFKLLENPGEIDDLDMNCYTVTNCKITD